MFRTSVTIHILGISEAGAQLLLSHNSPSARKWLVLGQSNSDKEGAGPWPIKHHSRLHHSRLLPSPLPSIFSVSSAGTFSQPLCAEFSNI